MSAVHVLKYLLVILILNISYFNYAYQNHKKENIEYEISQDSVWIQTSNGKIFGILYKPLGLDQKQIPAILCLQGGGDVGLTNYLYEAKFFAKNGMAALVCDKSGSGLSQTKKNWRQQSFKDKTEEYMELFLWLYNYYGIDKNKVGLHGMSEGGRLGLNMAINYPENIAFVNSVSGPIESFKENQLYAIEHLLNSQNVDEEIINQALDVWAMYFNDVAREKISEKTILQIKQLSKNSPELSYLPSHSSELPNRPLPQDIHFTLEEQLQRIQCPVLMQFGELDVLIDPKTSISLIPDKSNFRIKNYQATDHSMNLKNGDINPLFLSDKLIWIQGILNRY